MLLRQKITLTTYSVFLSTMLMLMGTAKKQRFRLMINTSSICDIAIICFGFLDFVLSMHTRMKWVACWAEGYAIPQSYF